MFTPWIVAQAAPPNGSIITSMLPLVLIFFIFWFLVVRPQAKQAQQHKAFLNALKVGDEVITAGGLFGKVVGIEDNALMIEISRGTRVRVARQQVQPAHSALPAPETKDAKDAKKEDSVIDMDDKSVKKDKKNKKDSDKNDSAEGDNAW